MTEMTQAVYDDMIAGIRCVSETNIDGKVIFQSMTSDDS